MIEGDFFVLRYAETKTINLDYFALIESQETSTASDSQPEMTHPEEDGGHV
jgi:hypothetical protein